jgi:diadenosine tetraphosphate (Ap4A) HIT family hydrolase
MTGECPFCPGQSSFEISNESAGALFDSFPVNRGHMLVVPLAHRRDIFACTPGELRDMWSLVEAARDLLEKRFSPDGYNIGTNSGASAGQTIFHCHIHVIPRYDGDAGNPRGGVRKVKEPLVDY